MADYQTLLKALSGEAQDNIYTGLGGVADTLGKSASVYAGTKDANVGEAMLASGILGLLGGGLGEYGKIQGAKDLGLASQVLLGNTKERPEGLGNSLYRNALTYRDILRRERSDKIADKLADARIDVTKDMLKGVNQEQIAIDYIDDRMAAQEAAKRGSLLAGKEGGEKILGQRVEASAPDASPSLVPMIAKRVPSGLQNKALEEVGTIKQIEDAFTQIDENMKLAYESATLRNTYLPGIVPTTSESGKLHDTAAANLTSNVLKIWKGPLDENDARRIVEPYIPDSNDNDRTLAVKTTGLKRLLTGNAKQTPILEQYGIRQRPTVDDVGTQQAPPGTEDAEVRKFIQDAKRIGMDMERAEELWNSGVRQMPNTLQTSRTPRG